MGKGEVNWIKLKFTVRNKAGSGYSMDKNSEFNNLRWA